MSDDAPKELSETSGAARKRQKKAQRQLDALAGPDDGKWANEFKKLGRPDFSSPETGLAWVRKVQLLIAYQMITYPFPSPSQRECWKRFVDMTKAMGMTHAKASVEDTVHELRRELDARKAAAGTVVEVAGSAIAKPATARGARLAPRVVPLGATVDVPDPARRPD